MVPTWTNLSLRSELPTGTRVLDLRSGVLWRIVTTEDGFALRTARWACLARPGTVVLVAEGPSTILDASGGREPVQERMTFGGKVGAVVETRREMQPAQLDKRETLGVIRIGFYGRTDPQTRGEVQVQAHRAAGRIGARGLLAEQKEAWATRWEQANVEVVGDPDLTRAVRLAIFHLMGSVADRGEAAVGARGLTGPAYGGHVFWDADVFVLPVLAATHPTAARAMLEYRIRRLPAARDQARQTRLAWGALSMGVGGTRQRRHAQGRHRWKRRDRCHPHRRPRRAHHRRCGVGGMAVSQLDGRLGFPRRLGASATHRHGPVLDESGTRRFGWGRTHRWRHRPRRVPRGRR